MKEPETGKKENTGKSGYSITTWRLHLWCRHPEWLRTTQEFYNRIAEFYYNLLLDHTDLWEMGSQQTLRELEIMSIPGRGGRIPSDPLPWQKVPLYFRRAAANEGIASAKSYLSRFAQDEKIGRAEKLNAAVTYYKGMYQDFSAKEITLRVWTGNEVALLWPGEMKLFNKAVGVRNSSDFENIKSFELINSLPISYDEGIENILAFTASCDGAVYRKFLETLKPDVVHIHTFMGLHKEFLEEAKKLEIRTVFSVHDFFSICPKVTMFRKGQICNCVDSCKECPECNMTALSEKKIFALQTPLYRKLKDSSIVKKLRKRHRDQYLSGDAEAAVTEQSTNTPDDYHKLRNYYKEMIDLISVVHYNSSVTKEVFEREFHPLKSYIIPITHGNTKDNRKIKSFQEPLRFSYLGPQGRAKGFFCSRRLSMSFGMKDISLV